MPLEAGQSEVAVVGCGKSQRFCLYSSRQIRDQEQNGARRPLSQSEWGRTEIVKGSVRSLGLQGTQRARTVTLIKKTFTTCNVRGETHQESGERRRKAKILNGS